MLKLGVLVSGSGSNLDAMIQVDLPIQVVIADRKCKGLEIAQGAGIQTHLIPRSFKADFDRETYTQQVEDLLRSHDIGLVAMAGWMTVFSPSIFGYYGRRVLNLHPSLLPDFPGDHAVRDALAAGVKVTGTTIHFATPKLDDGPILAQERVPVYANDDETRLHERIKAAERRLYPNIVRTLLQVLN